MKHVTSGVFALTVAVPTVHGAMFGPGAYQSASDSPFAGAAFQWWHLEDFDDGALNTPGVTAPVGQVLGPAPLTDSVEPGSSFYSGDQHHTLTFIFDAGALGGDLPTHAGIVWTDVGFLVSDVPPVASGGPADVIFEAFDALGVSLGVIGPVSVGDDAFNGGKDEDRFFGAVHAGGISRFTITMPQSKDWEVDHLQYGFVPAPASALILVAGAGMSRRARRAPLMRR